MENKKFNGFMVFMAVALLLLFISLRVSFMVSMVSSLIIVVLLRGCWILYNLLFKLFGGMNFERKEKRKI